jgi:hypothetical protein
MAKASKSPPQPVKQTPSSNVRQVADWEEAAEGTTSKSNQRQAGKSLQPTVQPTKPEVAKVPSSPLPVPDDRPISAAPFQWGYFGVSN